MNSTSVSRDAGKNTGVDEEYLRELVDRQDMSRLEKVSILRQWEFDLREQMVAEEENMGASTGPKVTLDEILAALRSLGAESEFRDVQTKHG